MSATDKKPRGFIVAAAAALIAAGLWGGYAGLVAEGAVQSGSPLPAAMLIGMPWLLGCIAGAQVVGAGLYMAYAGILLNYWARRNVAGGAMAVLWWHYAATVGFLIFGSLLPGNVFELRELQSCARTMGIALGMGWVGEVMVIGGLFVIASGARQFRLRSLLAALGAASTLIGIPVALVGEGDWRVGVAFAASAALILTFAATNWRTIANSAASVWSRGLWMMLLVMWGEIAALGFLEVRALGRAYFGDLQYFLVILSAVAAPCLWVIVPKESRSITMAICGLLLFWSAMLVLWTPA